MEYHKACSERSEDNLEKERLMAFLVKNTFTCCSRVEVKRRTSDETGTGKRETALEKGSVRGNRIVKSKPLGSGGGLWPGGEIV